MVVLLRYNVELVVLVLLMNKRIASYECEVIERDFLLVGESITANFPHSFPDAAIKVQVEFVKKRELVKNVVDKEVLFSPYMCNDIMATYFACLEVTELSDIPEGMVGFKVPTTKYAKVSCTNKTIDNGYNKVFEWMRENELKQKWFSSSFPIEIYYFEDNVEEEIVEILIPIHD